MKKFYIVNDYKDLLSGKVIPHKVLDYLPMNNNIMGQQFQQIPITKHTGLTISSESPIMPINSPFMYDPYQNMSITRTPIIQQNPSINNTMYGPPIIKLSPYTNQINNNSNGIFGYNNIYGSNGLNGLNSIYGTNVLNGSNGLNGLNGVYGSNGMYGTVKIMSDNNIFTLNVPINNLRNVVNYIYMNAQGNLDLTQPRVTFRIITPTIDSSISTTFNRMLEIVKVINSKYSNIVYLTQDGKKSNINSLLQTLLPLLNKQNINGYSGNLSNNQQFFPITASDTKTTILGSSAYSISIKGNFQYLIGNTIIGGPEKSILSEVTGGGIIPYDNDGAIHFLLGYNPNDLKWKWFGGGREITDTNPREIAYREALEETCKISNANDCYLPFMPYIINALENGNGLCIPVNLTGTNLWSNVYFIKISKPDWVMKYGKDNVDIPLGQIKDNEVSKMQWFSENQTRALPNLHPALSKIFDSYTTANLKPQLI